jgi:hypothetical protein
LGTGQKNAEKERKTAAKKKVRKPYRVQYDDDDDEMT